MKGGESLGNEEGSEETSEEDCEEEVSPARIYTPEVRPLISGVFLCLKTAGGQVSNIFEQQAIDRWVGWRQLRRREKEPDVIAREKGGLPVLERYAPT